MIKRFIPAAAIFIVGIVLAFSLWDFLEIPFENPHAIVSPLTDAAYNPKNNILRFVVFISIPSILFLLIPKKILFPFGISNKVSSQETTDGVSPKNSKKLAVVSTLILYCSAATVALTVPTFIASGDFDSFHEGESLGAAESYLHGQKPYTDYVFVHGVFQDPLRSVAAFSMFGKSIGAVRTAESLLKVVAWLLLMALCLSQYRSNPAYGAGVFFLFYALAISGGITVIQRDIPVLAFSLLTTHLLFRLKENTHKYFALSFFFLSFCAVFSFAYTVDRGLYLSVLSLLCFPLIFFLFPQTRLLRNILGLVAGAICGGMMFGFLIQWQWFQFFNFSFLVFPQYKDLADGIEFPIRHPRFFLFVACCAFLPFGLLASFRYTTQKVKSIKLADFIRSRFIEIYWTMLGLFLCYNTLGRADIAHLEYSSLGVLFALSVTVYSWSSHWLRKYIASENQYRLAAAMAVLASISALFLVIRRNDVQNNFPIAVPDSNFFSKSHRLTAQYLQREMKGSDYFFTLISDASWYYLLNQPCPTRFTVLFYAMTQQQQQETIRDLQSKAVKFVLYKNNHWANSINGFPIEQTHPILMDYIHQNYHFHAKILDNELWIENNLHQ